MVVVMLLGSSGAPVAAVIRWVGARVEKDVGKRSSSSASSPLPSMDMLKRGLARHTPLSSDSRPTQVSRDTREDLISSWKANSSRVRGKNSFNVKCNWTVYLDSTTTSILRWPLLTQGGVSEFGTDGHVIWKVEGGHPSTTPKPVGNCSQREQRGVGGPVAPASIFTEGSSCRAPGSTDRMKTFLLPWQPFTDRTNVIGQLCPALFQCHHVKPVWIWNVAHRRAPRFTHGLLISVTL